MIPGWPYSVVAALEPGRTSWTAVLDALGLGPDDDQTEVTAVQIREIVARLIEAGHWHEGDLRILVVFDVGHDVTRQAWLLADLPVELLGQLRSDRVMQLPAPPRQPGTIGRPRKHGGELALSDPATSPDPHVSTSTPGSPGLVSFANGRITEDSIGRGRLDSVLLREPNHAPDGGWTCRLTRRDRPADRRHHRGARQVARFGLAPAADSGTGHPGMRGIFQVFAVFGDVGTWRHHWRRQ